MKSYEQTSGSKSINSKSNFKDNKSRGWKEPSECDEHHEGCQMLDVQRKSCTSEVQEISEIAKLEETRPGTKIESLFQMSGPKSLGCCQWPAARRCRYCQGEHNSLLHLGEVAPSQDSSNEPVAESKGLQTAQVASMMTMTTGTVLLTTAKIRLISKTDHYQFVHC